METKTRYHALDILRGLSIILMMAHHFAVDLLMYDLVPAWLLDNFIFKFFQPVFASCFIALSGASSRFSKNNLKRGGKIAVAALIITGATAAATAIIDQNVTVYFGVLHFLALASVIYHFTHRFFDRVKIPALVWLAAFLAARQFFPMVGQSDFLFPLGIYGQSFFSADYYPLLPWIFVYFFGVRVADYIKDGRLPRWFYSIRQPFLEKVSQKSLIIYLVHQPVFLLLTVIISKIV